MRQFMCRGFDTGLAFSADGALLASYMETGQVALFDTGTGQLLKTLGSRQRPHDPTGTSLVFLGDGTRLVICRRGRELTSWDTTTSQSIWTEKDGGVGDKGAYSRDGGLIACSTITNKTVEIRDGMTGKVLQILPIGSASALAFSLDGTQLFSDTTDDMISVWDLTRLQRHQLSELNMPVSDLPSTATSPGSLNATKGKKMPGFFSRAHIH